MMSTNYILKPFIRKARTGISFVLKTKSINILPSLLARWNLLTNSMHAR